MKVTIVLFAVAMMTIGAWAISVDAENPSVQLAQQVITALKKGSTDDFVALFPTLAEFHAMMAKNNSVYGSSLNAAEEEFAAHYENEILPAVRSSFDALLLEGRQKGIEWEQITFQRVECAAGEDLEPVPFTIVFTASGREYRVTIDNAFMMNGIWKVSSEIHLI